MAFGVPERSFAVLYVSIMSLTRCYKTTVFTFIIIVVVVVIIITFIIRSMQS